jgi:YVTN family beta-propeller protein
MKKNIYSGLMVLMGMALLVAGCGDDSEKGGALGPSGENASPGMAGSGWEPGAGGGYGGYGGTSGAGWMDGGPEEQGSPPLPPENEQVVEFELPKAGVRYVFVANPESDSVAVIDAETYGVRTTTTNAKRPTFLQTISGTDTAIVLNVDSSEASVIRADSTEIDTNNLDVVEGANAIAVSPDGEHVVVYVNYALPSAGSSSGNYQRLTVLRLSDQGDEKVPLRVGFRPSNVAFSEDGSRGFVVTESGVSILDFAAIDDNPEEVPRTVELGYTPDEIPSDVSVTHDGRYALARLEQASVVNLVDLESGEIKALDLVNGEIVKRGAEGAGNGGTGTGDDSDAGQEPPREPDVVTDLDLSPDGTFAVAVLRSQSKVLRIPVPGAFADPSEMDSLEIDNVIIGSVTVAADSRHALLYTTADPPAGTSTADLRLIERITIVDLGGDKPQKTVQLEKSIAAVAIAPDSETAFIIHKKQDISGEIPGSEDWEIDQAYGYSLLKLSTGDPTLQTSQAPVGRFAIDTQGDYLFILFRSDALGKLLPDVIPLDRPPISVGLVPEFRRVFVSQEHPDGLITFFDWDTARSHAVTGFERNSRIQTY